MATVCAVNRQMIVNYTSAMQAYTLARQQPNQVASYTILKIVLLQK